MIKLIVQMYLIYHINNIHKMQLIHLQMMVIMNQMMPNTCMDIYDCIPEEVRIVIDLYQMIY